MFTSPERPDQDQVVNVLNIVTENMEEYRLPQQQQTITPSIVDKQITISLHTHQVFLNLK